MPSGPEPSPKHRLLVFSTVFPNAAQPHHGIFVRERMRGLPPEVEVMVVAPTPWFPFVAGLRPGYRPEMPRREVQDGVTVLHPRFLSFPGFLKCLDGVFLALGALPAILRLRRTFRFDAIDAHFVYPEGTAAVLLGRLFRVPVLVTLRGMLPILATFALRRPQIRWTLRRAARVIAVSTPLADDAVAVAGLPPERVRVIENGIDAGLFRPLDRAAARRELGLPAAGPIIVSVGTLAPRKGFDLVIEALPALAARLPGIRYVIVGGAGAEGAIEADLRALAARLGVAERMVFAGPRRRAELATFYNAADLSVLASSHEGSPNVVLEALACGTPVVGTPVGSNPWILADPDAGLLVERSVPALAEGIAAALSLPWDPRRVRARVAGRTWQAVGREVMEEIEAALGRVPGPASRKAPSPPDPLSHLPPKPPPGEGEKREGRAGNGRGAGGEGAFPEVPIETEVAS